MYRFDTASMAAKPSEGGNENTKSEVISKNTNWNEGTEKLIKGNLMTGDLESAIDCAMKCGRTPEALIIAMIAGSSVLEATVQSYLNKQNDAYIKGVLSKLYMKQYSQINDPMSNWKEIVAYVISYNAKYSDEVAKYAEELANKKGDLDSAILCAIIAENADLTIKYWMMKFNQTKNTLNIYQRYLAYQVMFEKIVLFKMFVQSFDNNKEADLIMSFYCKLLAELHMKEVAMKYSELINACTYSSIVKHRIACSDAILSKRYSTTPPFNVKPLEIIEKFEKMHNYQANPEKQMALPKPIEHKPINQPFFQNNPNPNIEKSKPLEDVKKPADRKLPPAPPKPVVFNPAKQHQNEQKEVNPTSTNKTFIPKAPSIPSRDSGGKIRESGGSKALQGINQEEVKSNPFGNTVPPPQKIIPKPPEPVEKPYIPANLGLNANFGLTKTEKV